MNEKELIVDLISSSLMLVDKLTNILLIVIFINCPDF